MPYNGSGTFNLSEPAFIFDTVISETAMNSDLSDIATGLSTAITKDGQTVITADIPMATYHLTGTGAGSDATDSVNLSQVQAAAFQTATDTGAADAYVIAPSPAISAYAAGQKFSFVSTNASTGASTLAVSGLAAKAVEYQGSALTGAEIASGSTIKVEYDGTAFQMVSPSALGLDSADIGVSVQGYDVDTLKADTADTLTAGFATTPDNFGTKSTGTFTPDEANGNFQYGVNGGAHTLAPPTLNSNILLQYTNNASAGAITTSGFTKVTGSFTTTDGDDFFAYITKNNGFSLLQIVALQ